MNKSTHSVTPRQPFSFKHTLAFAGGFSPMGGEQEADEKNLRFKKAYEIGGRAVLAEVTAGEGFALSVSLYAEVPLTEEEIAEALDRVRFTLSLDEDLDPFYELAEKDGAFAPVLRDQRGHHQVKFPSAFEITVWAVLGQRTPMAAARAVKRAMVEQFGTSIEVDGDLHAAFPSAGRLAGVPEAILRSVVKNAIKAAAIVEIARAFADIDEGWLRSGPYAEVSSWLARLPRIGAWSRAFVLYRGLGRMERLELKDGPILDCFRRVYGPRADLTQVAASYGDHVGTWCLYLRTAGAGIPGRGRQAA